MGLRNRNDLSGLELIDIKGSKIEMTKCPEIKI